MTRIILTIARIIIFSLCMISANAIAETSDLLSIEAQERAQIISELTFHLETKQVCTQTLNWDDSGSGADLDGYFFIPTLGNNDFMIGGHASQKRTSKYHCVTTVSEPASKSKGAPPLLVVPTDWRQVWKDSGSGATKDGSFWQAIPPDNNYKCIGSVSQLGHNTKPNLPKYRCVHTSLTDDIVTSAIVWSDIGTGADKQVTIFGLPATGTFTAVASRAGKIESYDLKKNAASVPDPKMVEEILAQRLGPIKADIEAKVAAIKKQKEEVRIEEANKAAAKEAEQKKLAERAAKKKQAKAAERKALAEQKQSEQEESAEAAQRLKEEQQARVAKVAAAAEQQKVAAEEKAAEQKQEAIQEPVQEEVKQVEQAEPELMMEAPAEIEVSSTSEPKNESKGLKDILMFFVKVLAIMVGGVVIFIVAFKVLFGKKNAT